MLKSNDKNERFRHLRAVPPYGGGKEEGVAQCHSDTVGE